MADVYLAAASGPHDFRKLVVLKTLKPALAAEPEYRRMFLDEARLAARLNHPNVVQTYEVDVDDDRQFIAMELLEGQPVARIAKEARARGVILEPSFWLRVACDALAGLEHAHALRDYDGRPLGIVHRDVSPQNLFVTYEGQTKVLDFGVAKAAMLTADTVAGVRKGKLAYMPPEQARGDSVDRRADVFAMGVVLWELLSGRRLLFGASFEETLRRVLSNEPLARLSSVSPGVPGCVDEAVARALERDPDRRWPTAAAMKEALEDCVAELGVSKRGEVMTTLAGLFERRRDEEQRAISRQMLALRGCETAEAPRPPMEPEAAPPPTARSSPPVEVFALSSSPPRRRRIGWLVATAVAGVAGVFGVGALAALGAARGSPRPERLAPAPGAFSAAAAIAAPSPACPTGMISIPGGNFFMGNDEGLENERPAHKVTLSPYCIDELEVTTDDYRECTARGDCKRAFSSNLWPGISDREREAYDPLCNVRAASERATHPINCVDWDMARSYCEVHGNRLPTEAEWEFAARGPDGRRYPWGDEAPSPELLNACGSECAAWGKQHGLELMPMYAGGDGFTGTAPVGSFPKGASRYGLKDVVGNVWEWVADFSGPYATETAVNPKGPEKGAARVMRGGAWNGAYASWVRPTFRFAATPSMRSHGVGFRCAR
jgi:eukaryotic-like serine/threonine-protein kinase